MADNLTAEYLTAEHERLQRITEELARAHDELRRQSPRDWPAHLEHETRLREHIQALRDHLQHLRGET